MCLVPCVSFLKLLQYAELSLWVPLLTQPVLLLNSTPCYDHALPICATSTVLSKKPLSGRHYIQQVAHNFKCHARICCCQQNRHVLLQSHANKIGCDVPDAGYHLMRTILETYQV